jgi:ribonuclease HI
MEIYCDGLCEPNPGGYATWGFAAVDAGGTGGSTEWVHKAHGLIGYGPGMTNNLAEFTAVLQALMWAYQAGHRSFVLKTDSQLVVNQVLGRWQVKAGHIQPLVERIRNSMQACEVCELQWVPREQNLLADEQSRIAYREATGQQKDDASLYSQAIRDLDAMDAELEEGFETDFVVSNLARVNQYGDGTHFSDKQRAVIVRLAGKYLSQGLEDGM